MPEKLSSQALAALKAQREAFRAKFGRDPGPDDPVFFDADADTPKAVLADELMNEIIVAMRVADLPPEFEYAYRKTGLLGIGANKGLWPQEHIDEWNAAVAEYQAMEIPGWSDEDKARWKHSNEHPAFKGVYEFDITFEALGEKVTRRARANYQYTPEWEYFDLKKQAP